MPVRSLSVAILLFAVVVAGWAADQTDEAIQYLLNYVASSHVTFLRNGAEHTPAQAVEHIKAKYAHFKGDIKTPEDFIRLCASKSLLSGQPYKVRLSNGTEKALSEWLTEALAEHRAKSR